MKEIIILKLKYYFNIDNLKDKCRMSYLYSIYNDMATGRVKVEHALKRDYKKHKKLFLNRHS